MSMLSEHTVARAARNAGIDAPVHFTEVTDSTNDDLLALAEGGAPDWTVAATNHQRAGRGRLGRTWISSPGSSLLVSVLLRPQGPPTEAALVTLGAGACMALACSVACGIDVLCTWPNDLVVGERKVGGVLVEARMEGGRLSHAVIGTGVNLEQRAGDFPPELQAAATSVTMEGGRPDVAALLFEYLFRLKRFCDPARPAFADTVLDLYRRHCATIGRAVRATSTEGREVEGTATGVGDLGQLLVQTAAGIEEVAFGEIAHLG
jgi:BirA family transcriptional regulator, biotin operon repressor / biotin---[acetyl-CoA-carboxylase] ligase